MSNYPFNGESPRTVIFAESGTVAEIRAKLEQLAGVAKIKRKAFHPEGEVLMCELNPKLLTNEERGKGESTNARLHRILHPEAR